MHGGTSTLFPRDQLPELSFKLNKCISLYFSIFLLYTTAATNKIDNRVAALNLTRRR